VVNHRPLQQAPALTGRYAANQTAIRSGRTLQPRRNRL